MKSYKRVVVLDVNGTYYYNNDIVSLDLWDCDENTKRMDTVNLVGRLIIKSIEESVQLDNSAGMQRSLKSIPLNKIASIKKKDGVVSVKANKAEVKYSLVCIENKTENKSMWFIGDTVEITYGHFFNRKKAVGKITSMDYCWIDIDTSSQFNADTKSIHIDNIVDIKKTDKEGIVNG